MKIMNFKMLRLAAAVGCVALGVVSSNGVGQPQSSATIDAEGPAVSLPAALNDVVKLTKAGISEDIILAQIKTMSLTPLTTDQIVYLGSVGVSQNVIRALIQLGNSSASSNRSQAAESKPTASYPAPAPAASQAPSADQQGSNPPVASSNPPAASAPAPSAFAQPQIVPGPQPPPVPPTVVSLAVPADFPWVDSGIDLAPGDTVTVAATGAVSLAQHLPFIPNFETPDGNPKFPSTDMFHPFIAPGLPAWSLVGRVSQLGIAFEVGSSSTFAAPAAGRRYDQKLGTAG